MRAGFALTLLVTLCLGALLSHAQPRSAGSPSSLVATSSASASATPSASADPPKNTPTLVDTHQTEAPTDRATRARPGHDELPLALCGRIACLHARPGTPRASLESASRIVENFAATFRALKLPLPARDGIRGGGGALDVYLEDVDVARSFADTDSVDPITGGASAFIVAPSSIRYDSGCFAEQDLATAFATAALLGQDSAVDTRVSDMIANHLASITTPCSVRELEAIDTFQRSPDRCFLGTPDAPDAQPGAFLFPRYLEERFGSGIPGELSTSLVSISKQRGLVDEPDAIDALRVSLKAQKTSLGDTLLDFAVARAFLGSRSDGMHLGDVARYGDLGRVRFEWSVTMESLPRRLAPSRPLDAFGSTYIYVDVSKAPPNAELNFVAEWELPFLFRWALVRVDAEGVEIGRTDVAPIFGEHRAEKALRDLNGTAGVMIVGVNDGEWSKAEPFDPSLPRFLPKSYAVTVYP